MWEFAYCNGCPFVNYGGGGGTCDCINPMSDWSGLIMSRSLISHGPEDDARMEKVKEGRHQEYQKNLKVLFPSEETRTEFLRRSREELGGLSIADMREKMLYGIEVSEDIVTYLAGERRRGSGWDRWFSNAVGGYFQPDEREDWLNSPNELLGGGTNRDIAANGGLRVLTEILWFLLLTNPTGKNAPMFGKPKPMSQAEEEMLLDEHFPESAYKGVYSYPTTQGEEKEESSLGAVIMAIISFLR